VDFVAVTETPTAVEAIQAIRPAVYVKGSDYADDGDDLTGKIVDERRAVETGGGRVHFTDDNHLQLHRAAERPLRRLPRRSPDLPARLRHRHSADEIIDLLKALRSLKVLVIGDTIIDEYHYVQSMGKSPKELLVATRFLRAEEFAGGILACANHIAGFCDRVDLVTCLGTRDAREEFIRSHLKGNISPTFLTHVARILAVKEGWADVCP